MPRQGAAVKEAIDALITSLSGNNQTLIDQQITVLEQIGLQRGIEYPAAVLARLFDEVVGSVPLGSMHPYVLLRILKIVHLYAELTFFQQKSVQEKSGSYRIDGTKINGWRGILDRIRRSIGRGSYNLVLLFELECITNCINLLDKSVGTLDVVKKALIEVANACFGDIDVSKIVNLIVDLYKNRYSGVQWYGSVLALRSVCASMLKQHSGNIKAFFNDLSSTTRPEDKDYTALMNMWQFRCCVIDVLAMLVTEVKDPATRNSLLELLKKYGSDFSYSDVTKVDEGAGRVVLEYTAALFKLHWNQSLRGDISVSIGRLLDKLSSDLGAASSDGDMRSLECIRILKGWYNVMRDRETSLVSQAVPQVAPAPQVPHQEPLELNVTAARNIHSFSVEEGARLEIEADISRAGYRSGEDEMDLERIMKAQKETAKALMEGRNVTVTAFENKTGEVVVRGRGVVRAVASVTRTDREAASSPTAQAASPASAAPSPQSATEGGKKAESSRHRRHHHHPSKEHRHHSEGQSKGKAPAHEPAGERVSQETPTLRDPDAAPPVTQAYFERGRTGLPRLSLPARFEDKKAIEAVEKALDEAYPSEGADAEIQKCRRTVLEELRGFRGRGLTFEERDQLSQRAQELRRLVAATGTQAEPESDQQGDLPRP